MNAQEYKIAILKKLDSIDDNYILSIIYDVLKNSERMKAQYNKELDEAEARIDAGEYHTQKEVENILQKNNF